MDCPRCGGNFGSYKSLLLRHLRSKSVCHPHLEDIPRDKIISQLSKKTFECIHCGKQLASKFSLDRHLSKCKETGPYSIEDLDILSVAPYLQTEHDKGGLENVNVIVRLIYFNDNAPWNKCIRLVDGYLFVKEKGMWESLTKPDLHDFDLCFNDSPEYGFINLMLLTIQLLEDFRRNNKTQWYKYSCLKDIKNYLSPFTVDKGKQMTMNMKVAKNFFDSAKLNNLFGQFK